MADDAQVRIVEVALGERSYPIYVGRGLLGHSEQLLGHISGRQVAVITNEVVAPLWLDKLLAALSGSNMQIDVLTLPDGEAQKTLANYGRILDFLIDKRHNRTTTLIALGGGVVGDMTGFAAATYQRGVGFVQVPTTLLAQVDSSVGGKTAVNHPAGKNLIGAFYQPKAVFADVDLLSTLPPREFSAGLAEVLKYGVIADADFFHWLLEHAAALASRDGDALIHAVCRSCELKARVVEADETESGVRAILNYGHTFGHALESLTGYTTLLHGEAVALGMVMAADLSARQGLLAWEHAQLISSAVAALGLPVTPPELAAGDMLAAMGMDKKVIDGRLRLVLAREIGSALVTEDVLESNLLATLTAGAGLCHG